MTVFEGKGLLLLIALLLAQCLQLGDGIEILGAPRSPLDVDQARETRQRYSTPDTVATWL